MGFPRFERGTLGMWGLGRDDACDRFFIALAPQPELDGLRTAFAEVLHGMGVVDRLQPENRIERVIIR